MHYSTLKGIVVTIKNTPFQLADQVYSRTAPKQSVDTISSGDVKALTEDAKLLFQAFRTCETYQAKKDLLNNLSKLDVPVENWFPQLFWHINDEGDAYQFRDANTASPIHDTQTNNCSAKQPYEENSKEWESILSDASISNTIFDQHLNVMRILNQPHMNGIQCEIENKLRNLTSICNQIQNGTVNHAELCYEILNNKLKLDTSIIDKIKKREPSSVNIFTYHELREIKCVIIKRLIQLENIKEKIKNDDISFKEFYDSINDGVLPVEKLMLDKLDLSILDKNGVLEKLKKGLTSWEDIFELIKTGKPEHKLHLKADVLKEMRRYGVFNSSIVIASRSDLVNCCNLSPVKVLQEINDVNSCDTGAGQRVEMIYQLLKYPHLVKAFMYGPPVTLYSQSSYIFQMFLYVWELHNRPIPMLEIFRSLILDDIKNPDKFDGLQTILDTTKRIFTGFPITLINSQKRLDDHFSKNPSCRREIQEHAEVSLDKWLSDLASRNLISDVFQSRILIALIFNMCHNSNDMKEVLFKHLLNLDAPAYWLPIFFDNQSYIMDILKKFGKIKFKDGDEFLNFLHQPGLNISLFRMTRTLEQLPQSLRKELATYFCQSPEVLEELIRKETESTSVAKFNDLLKSFSLNSPMTLSQWKAETESTTT